MTEENRYIHGTAKEEQGRLRLLNSITNGSFIHFLGDLKGRKIADFGCGTGDFIADIAKKYDTAEITGIEISRAQYDEAVAKNGGNPNVTLINSDVLKSGLEDDSFDLCYCRYLLEHVEDPVAVVKEMLRVVKRGGLVRAQENDLAVVFYHPEVKGLDAVCREFCALQVELGGDPFIGRKLFNIFKKAGAVIKGDSRVAAISAASILAKVARDRQMIEMDNLYPGYGLAKHKGYPTIARV